MSKSRLTALLAALAVAAVAVFAAGCGSSDDSTSRRRRWRRRRNAHGRLRHPLSAVRAIRQDQAELHGLRRRTDGSDRRKDRPHAEFQDTSFDTIFRDLAQGKFDIGRLGDDDHRRTRGRRSTSPIPTTCRRNSRSWSRKAATSTSSRQDLEGKIVGVQQGTTGRGTTSKKKSNASELRPYPAGARRDQRAQGRHGRSGRHRPPGRRKRGRRQTAASKSSGRSPTEEQYGIRGQQGQRPNCSTNSTKAWRK